MYYKSTRGGFGPVPSARAIKMGIAPDGGLFVPEKLVKFSLEQINSLVELDYKKRAIYILEQYLTDYTHDEIVECVNNAYSDDKFENANIAPVVKLNENVSILELWHGPTCAFKDMALQILPWLLIKAVKKTEDDNEIVILVATSGDTGKAALEGFKDVSGTKIIVFYPQDGVSEVQRMQMITQEGNNVYSVGVKGNFDDVQNGVKAIFTNKHLVDKMKKSNYKFSSANSINWGRLVPQIVYYFSAYADLVKDGKIKIGEKVNFVVPTGNFGNILAAYYAKEMGLPVNKLICASNENNVLTEFINTRIYNKNRKFVKTISPSMDILISSNLERLLYELTGHDSDILNKWMKELAEEGVYNIDIETGKKISEIFWAGYSNEEEILKTIGCIYDEYKYVVDTHTAVGIDVYDKYVISTGDMTKSIIVSTASPFKFNESVAQAILGDGKTRGKNEFELLQVLSKECFLKIPDGLRDLVKKEVRHNDFCKKSDMVTQVEKTLKI